MYLLFIYLLCYSLASQLDCNLVMVLLKAQVFILFVYIYLFSLIEKKTFSSDNEVSVYIMFSYIYFYISILLRLISLYRLTCMSVL